MDKKKPRVPATTQVFEVRIRVRAKTVSEAIRESLTLEKKPLEVTQQGNILSVNLLKAE